MTLAPSFELIGADELVTARLVDIGAGRRGYGAPEAHVTPGYAAAFDAETLVYDCFESSDGRSVNLIGPPLTDIEDCVDAVHGGGRAAAPVKRDRLSWWTLPAQAGEIASLGIFGRDRARSLSFRPARADPVFDDMRVALMKFRYEPLEWVTDWLDYHVRAHGVEAAVIYCNNPTEVSPRETLDAMRRIAGLKALRVVDWRYPFGPVWGAGGPDYWKGHFCQLGMLEHARLRYLRRARSVVSLDVDELLVSETAPSVFDRFETDEAGHVFVQSWAIFMDEAAALASRRRRRHRDFDRLAPGGARGLEPGAGAVKWICAPRRQPFDAQWGVHKIPNSIEGDPRGAWCAHFMQLNMGWKQPGRELLSSSGPASAELAGAFARIGWR